jgi:predicted adenylyl cyclase CyaB
VRSIDNKLRILPEILCWSFYDDIMLEVEAKIRVKNFDEAKKNLEKLGAEKIAEKEQTDRVYGRDEDLDEEHKIIEGRFSARIRKVNEVCRIDFKEILRGKAGDEHNIDVDDMDEGDKFLRALGFEEAFTSSKKRAEWQLEDFKICLDDFPKLGMFIEAEKEFEKGTGREEAHRSCVEVLKKIDPNGEIEDKKYGDLIQEVINKEGSF